jgi:hypothetical protein
MMCASIRFYLGSTGKVEMDLESIRTGLLQQYGATARNEVLVALVVDGLEQFDRLNSEIRKQPIIRGRHKVLASSVLQSRKIAAHCLALLNSLANVRIGNEASQADKAEETVAEFMKRFEEESVESAAAALQEAVGTTNGNG